MYPPKDLQKIFKKYQHSDRYSKRLPDFSKRFCLEMINLAINCCEKWGSFLDVGASSGHYSAALIKKFSKGVAVEVEPNEYLDDLVSKNKNLSVFNDYMQNFPVKDTKIDFVFLSDVFEHIPLNEVENVMKKISKNQSYGGVVYISTPNTLFCGPVDQSDTYYKKHQFGHYKHYTVNEVSNLWKKHGYETIFVCYEYGSLRHFFEKHFWRFSIKDRQFFNKSKFYKYLSYPFILLLKPLFYLIEMIVYSNEKRNRNNSFDSMSTTFILKKIL